MAVIYSPLLRQVLQVHDNILAGYSYPFFDPACCYYEALRAAIVEHRALAQVYDTYGISQYQYRRALAAFKAGGTAKLIGLSFPKLIETFDCEVERMVYVLKSARSHIPATKMVTIVQGFGHDIPIALMRKIYASYGWSHALKSQYPHVDFWQLNLKIIQLDQLQRKAVGQDGFFNGDDWLQQLLEVLRNQNQKGAGKKFPGSRVSFAKYKKSFQQLGLIGLVAQAKPAFRNSKLGFKQEGWMILSRIQHPKKTETDYQQMLGRKQINVDISCITKIFKRWNVVAFESKFKGDLQRLLTDSVPAVEIEPVPAAEPIGLNYGFVDYVRQLSEAPAALANPGLFLFLPLLNQLKLFDFAATLIDLDPDNGYSWFSLLMLNLSRIFNGISSVSRAAGVHELSLPLSAALVQMPCKDSMLNALAQISENQLLLLRRYLTRVAYDQQLVHGHTIALDFHMRDFTGDDIALKNITKGPSPKRKICFPGFRPHIAWDIDTGAPLSLEFRRGAARATTSFKRFINELLPDALTDHHVDHIYLDSEYTAQKLWHFVVDQKNGMGCDLTMCIKQNRAVKKHIDAFLDTKFNWLFYDEDHSFSDKTFIIPIQQSQKQMHCVLKRHEKTGKFRCFGSTLPGLDSQAILTEYKRRWAVENGIKDLVGNYYFDNIPGIDPHRINVHYFVVTLARLLYQMFCNLYPASKNPDQTQKTISAIRHEFIAGSNASITRNNDQLIITWLDPYPENYHKQLSQLFSSLNQIANQPIAFLGGLRLKFKLAAPRDKDFRNVFKRVRLDLG